MARAKSVKRRGSGRPAKVRAQSPRHRDRAGTDTRRPKRASAAQRRETILAAALEEFSRQGFSAARLDDVAQRAGVAKGTIYLYFRDKDALFEELIRSVLSPVVGALDAALRDNRPVREIAEVAIDIFVREVYGTSRRDVIRLVLSEGPRFPQIAEFYYREVLTHIFAAVRAMLQRAATQGELREPAIVQFPQLVGAPAVVAILWNSLFERFEPLDARSFMRAQLDLIFIDSRKP